MDSAGAHEPADGPQAGGALDAAFDALEAVGPFSFAPVRAGASFIPSDIQFDLSDFPCCATAKLRHQRAIPDASDGHRFLTAALERRPARADQAETGHALGVLEHHYRWGVAHLVTFVAMGCLTSVGYPAGWCPPHATAGLRRRPVRAGGGTARPT